jgi:hypothetical protein
MESKPYGRIGRALAENNYRVDRFPGRFELQRGDDQLV